MDAFITGAWRSPSRGEVYLGGQWRRLSRAEAYLGDNWRSVAKFIAPLAVTAFDTFGSRTGATRPGTVVSDVATATPSGGLAPYSYSWVILSGGAAITNPSSASTRFSQVLSTYDTQTSTARVTCTDALGSTASATITVTLESEGNN